MSCSSNGQTGLDSGNPSPVHGNPLPKHSNRPPSAKSLRKPASLSSIPSPTPILQNGRSHAVIFPTGRLNTISRFSPSGVTVSPLVSPPTPNTSSDFRCLHGSISSSNPGNTSTGNGCHGKKLLKNASHGQTGKLLNSCRTISSTTNQSSPRSHHEKTQPKPGFDNIQLIPHSFGISGKSVFNRY